MTEAEKAVEWLETQNPYILDEWTDPDLGPDDSYTSYFASFKYDTCNADVDPDNTFCSQCQTTFPKYITSIDWDWKDDEVWMLRRKCTGSRYNLTSVHARYSDLGYKNPEYVQ